MQNEQELKTQAAAISREIGLVNTRASADFVYRVLVVNNLLDDVIKNTEAVKKILDGRADVEQAWIARIEQLEARLEKIEGRKASA